MEHTPFRLIFPSGIFTMNSRNFQPTSDRRPLETGPNIAQPSLRSFNSKQRWRIVANNVNIQLHSWNPSDSGCVLLLPEESSKSIARKMSRKSRTSLENEIERARWEGKWNEIPKLVEQLSTRTTTEKHIGEQF